MESTAKLIMITLEELGVRTDAEGPTKLASYVDELAKWNKHINLVGLIERKLIISDLVSDGLFLHTVIPAKSTVIDLGSGGGILSVPLAILDPGRRVLSVDKSLKKTQFQRHIKRLIELPNFEVLRGRAEDLSPLHAATLVAKAFGSVREILEKGGAHLDGGGSAYLVRGAAETAPEERGFVLMDVRSYRLPRNDKVYHLFVYKKVT
jgi:16S rRNA (guanine527-N7)-methyltransferase